MKISCFVLASALSFAGCASVVRGTPEQVVINAEPSDARIQTDLGHSCSQSPCSVEVSRKTPFTAVATKEGYKSGQVYVGTKMSNEGFAGIAGNVLIGGVIGAGVDVATGATLDHYPNPVRIVLVPEGSPDESTIIMKPPVSNNPDLRPTS